MPITFIDPEAKDTNGRIILPNGKVLGICNDSWDLKEQMSELEGWLKDNKDMFDKGNYYADIGFILRKDSTDRSTIVEVEFMKMLIEIGMELWFSEYDI